MQNRVQFYKCRFMVVSRHVLSKFFEFETNFFHLSCHPLAKFAFFHAIIWRKWHVFGRFSDQNRVFPRSFVENSVFFRDHLTKIEFSINHSTKIAFFSECHGIFCNPLLNLVFLLWPFNKNRVHSSYYLIFLKNSILMTAGILSFGATGSFIIFGILRTCKQIVRQRQTEYINKF